MKNIMVHCAQAAAGAASRLLAQILEKEVFCIGAARTA